MKHKLRLLKRSLYEPKQKVYGIAIDKFNTWMSFSHITPQHLFLIIASFLINDKKEIKAFFE